VIGIDIDGRGGKDTISGGARPRPSPPVKWTWVMKPGWDSPAF
jgi:hypothetical protein